MVIPIAGKYGSKTGYIRIVGGCTVNESPIELSFTKRYKTPVNTATQFLLDGNTRPVLALPP